MTCYYITPMYSFNIIGGNGYMKWKRPRQSSHIQSQIQETIN